MNDFLKNIFMYIIKIILSPIKLFPIQENFIMFCTNSGAGYFCNPKYLYEYMKENKKNYKYIWTFKNPKKFNYLKDENTIICKYRSLKYYYYKIVSKYYITNAIEGSETPKKKKQIKIQTWHGGGCYKKVALSEKGKSKMYLKRIQSNIETFDYFVSSSEIFTNIIKDNFKYKKNIIESGMPRNDILFDNEKIVTIRKKVEKYYNINENDFIVLYAPTWRYNDSKLERIEFDGLKATLEKKYNKNITILYRAHFHMKEECNANVLDVTEYEDMQELLISTDLLISDYSSAIWDYSFLNRPCILFCPDLEYYIEKRGFVIDIKKWGFPICKTNEELMNSILKFSEIEFKNSMKNHHNMLKSFETGNASKEIIKIMKI